MKLSCLNLAKPKNSGDSSSERCEKLICFSFSQRLDRMISENCNFPLTKIPQGQHLNFKLQDATSEWPVCLFDLLNVVKFDFKSLSFYRAIWHSRSMVHWKKRNINPNMVVSVVTILVVVDKTVVTTHQIPTHHTNCSGHQDTAQPFQTALRRASGVRSHP